MGFDPVVKKFFGKSTEPTDFSFKSSFKPREVPHKVFNRYVSNQSITGFIVLGSNLIAYSWHLCRPAFAHFQVSYFLHHKMHLGSNLPTI